MANLNDRRTRTSSRGSSSRISTRSYSTARASRNERNNRSTGTSRSSREGADAQRASRSSGSTRSTRTKRDRSATRGTAANRTTTRRTSERIPVYDQAEPNLQAIPGGHYQEGAPEQQPELVSTSVGELRRAERSKRLRNSSRRYFMRFIIIIGVVVALLAGWAALYNSPAFTIEHVQVNGVEHLTNDEMSQLANVPAGTTLLRVDTDSIRNRLLQTAWIEDAEVKRVFPNTLEINVDERAVQAIVEISTSTGGNVKSWAISDDHIWLMPIPEKGSEAAKTTSSKIYEDAESALHIVDVPYGTKAEIGKVCSDNNVNNALEIINGMTTDLRDHVEKVSAAGPAETTLILDNGVEIAFGKAEDIRDKERVILKILEDNPDGVAYINVRMVDSPTWRAV